MWETDHLCSGECPRSPAECFNLLLPTTSIKLREMSQSGRRSFSSLEVCSTWNSKEFLQMHLFFIDRKCSHLFSSVLLSKRQSCHQSRGFYVNMLSECDGSECRSRFLSSHGDIDKPALLCYKMILKWLEFSCPRLFIGLSPSLVSLSSICPRSHTGHFPTADTTKFLLF